MARFNFRLQQFLNIKEQIETQRELEYAQALRRLEEERQRLRQMEAKRLEQIEDFRKSLLEAVKPDRIRRYNNTIERLKAMIREQEKRIAAAEAFAEKKRLALVDAMKERKSFEKLRENTMDEYRRAELMSEQKQVDELVSYQYGKR
jgi:flagellar FliJ protein